MVHPGVIIVATDNTDAADGPLCGKETTALEEELDMCEDIDEGGGDMDERIHDDEDGEADSVLD
jgi:hypothetical protein